MLKCFLATGFDSEEAIAYMDEDSVKTMETFIEKRFSHDPNMHSSKIENFAIAFLLQLSVLKLFKN